MAHLASKQVAEYLAKPAVHEKWEGDYRTPDNEVFYNLACDALVRTLQAPADAILLDAGCGPGFHSMRFARRGFRVQALDFSGKRSRTGRGQHPRQRSRRPHHPATRKPARPTVSRRPFPVRLVLGRPHAHPGRGPAVVELARVVRPGGTLIMSEANCRSLQAAGFRLHQALVWPGEGGAGPHAGGRRILGDARLRQAGDARDRHPVADVTLPAARLDLEATPRRPVHRSLHARADTAAQESSCIFSTACGSARSAGPVSAFGNLLVFEKAVR